MVLEPGEVEAIARAVVAQAAVGTALGLIIGLVTGFLLNLKVVGPRVADMAEQRVTRAILDPEGAVQKARVKEMNELVGKVAKPDLTGLKIKVDLSEEFKSDEFQAAMQTAFKSAWAKRGLGAVANDEGMLTPEQQREVELLAADPDGKAMLVAAENALDLAVSQKALKPATAKAVKKQLQAAFESGQPLDMVLAPYQNLLARFLGGTGGAPSVSVHSRTGPV